jgi:hypothetical protein
VRKALLAAALLAACSSGESGHTLLSPSTQASPEITTTSTTEPPAPPVVACDPAPFVPSELPDAVAAEQPETREIPYDQYTIISGTSTSVWTADDGTPVLALIRGSLPPAPWLATPQRISVRGVDAALGMLPDGVWGIAWFEGPARCDEYTIVQYPPADAETVRAVAESLVEGERAP